MYVIHFTVNKPILVLISYDLPMGREFNGNFLKNVKSPPHASPPPLRRLYIDRCLKSYISQLISFVSFLFIHVYLPSRFLHLQTRCSNWSASSNLRANLSLNAVIDSLSKTLKEQFSSWFSLFCVRRSSPTQGARSSSNSVSYKHSFKASRRRSV